jgi:hypothetical protein
MMLENFPPDTSERPVDPTGRSLPTSLDQFVFAAFRPDGSGLR